MLSHSAPQPCRSPAAARPNSCRLGLVACDNLLGNCHVESIVSNDMPILRQPSSEFRTSLKTCVLILASLFCLFVDCCLVQKPIRVYVWLVNVALSSLD